MLQCLLVDSCASVFIYLRVRTRGDMLGVTRTLLLLAVLCWGALGEEETTAEPLNFGKMRIKELKRFLKARGLECKGCAEKNEFVKMASENENTPLVETKKKSSTPPKKEGASFGGDSNIDDLLASMKKMGMNGNVFTKDDLEKMNNDGKGYDDMFKNGGGAGGQGYTPPKRSKKSKEKNRKTTNDRVDSEAKEQGTETIEL